MLFSLMLIGLGVYAYQVTDGASVTALIPAFLGGVTLILGLLGLTSRWSRLSVYLVMFFLVVGFFGAFDGVVAVVKHFFGGDLARPAAAFSKAAMCLICIFYFFACFLSLKMNKCRKKLPRMIV